MSRHAPNRVTAAWAVMISLAALDAAAVPAGQSPFIYGMHDHPGNGFFPVVDGCTRGWVTDLRYIGDQGTCGAGDIDMQALADQGLGVIMRLDWGGSPALPPLSSQWDGYASAFADCVRRARGVRVFVVGNEPNIPWGHPENRTFSPDEVGDIYRRVVAAVDGLAGGGAHEILMPAMAPWASLAPWGDWDDGLAAAIDNVRNNGGSVDGVAIHAYTRADFTAGAISSDAWFPGRENKWHLHFRGYRDTLALLSARGIVGIPLYITESGNACDPPCQPYPDEDRGYFVAMYEEIHAWNQANPAQLIRAVTPYRWTQNDDGSGRDFCISCKSGLRADMQNAMAMGRTWSASGCSNAPAPADAGHQGDAAVSDATVPDASLPDGGHHDDASLVADASRRDAAAADGSAELGDDGGMSPDGARETDMRPIGSCACDECDDGMPGFAALAAAAWAGARRRRGG